MALQVATWLQVSGYRYRLRRIEIALLDVLQCSPGRLWRNSLAVGCVLTVIALTGCLLLSRLWPQPGLGDARIVMGQASGALYVKVADTWHPVLNLASARLIAATDANPRPVAESALARTKRGPLLGIPGAPGLIAPALPAQESRWTVCDSAGGTAVLLGVDSPAGRVGGGQALLVAARTGGPAYLLYRGRRALVDLADRAVVRALRLPDRAPRIVSQTLLNAVPEAPPIAAPRLPGAGGPAGAWLPGFRVGTVLRITRAAGDEYYVVLNAGVQRISQVIADLLRFEVSAEITTVDPGLLRTAPSVDTLPVSGIPEQVPSDPGGSTWCAVWTPVASGPPDIGFLADPRPSATGAVRLAQADGPGPAVDAFSLAAGHSAYVATQSRVGNSTRVDTRYLVTDTGVRFAIHDDEAAHLLGLPATPTPAPWPVLAALPCGPELSREKASVARDTLQPGP
ncbi:type VII secretion protein EccB [Mycobacterium gordonae]|uniref:Type VII secretion protein EccB n=1 Tax=Mycobacterium gordonae TaxID=1778 RepID=A0A0Q2U9P1_MYCGO|nr:MULTISPECIES: type VII secretion protein EccB [Mycobacterium]KQH77248.1 type VII secretion protein EccB [Mycobacterium gordonae]MDP7730132.1 type VII secretion protein EccB [Mycobacterium sp. TY813]